MIAAYMRVSTEDQKDKETVESQRFEIERYCRENKVQIAYWYSDEDVTGKKDFGDRPQGRALLNDAKAGKFKTVIVTRVDRLARESGVFFAIQRELSKLGIAIVTTRERMDDSPGGRLKTGIQVVVASYEHELIRERSMLGMRRLLDTPNWYCGGIIPYGYRVIGEKKSARYEEDNTPLPGNPALTPAEVVRQMYRFAADRKSSYWIADYLNAAKIPTDYTLDKRQIVKEGEKGKRKENTANFWTNSAVTRLLKNEFYKGIHIYGKRSQDPNRERVTREVLPLVPVDVWEKANQVIPDNLKFAKRNARRSYLLKSLIRCAVCQSTYCGTPGGTGDRPTLYYRCVGRMKYRAVKLKRENGLSEREKCPAKDIKASVIEDRVWADIEKFLRNPGDTIKLLEAKIASEHSTAKANTKRIADLDAALKKNERAQVNLLKSIAEAGSSASKFHAAIAELAEEEKKLSEARDELRDSERREREKLGRLTGVRGQLEALSEHLDEPVSFELKQSLVRSLVQDIVVSTTTGEDGKKRCQVRIKFVFSAATSATNPTVITSRTGTRVECNPTGALTLERVYAA